MFLATAGLFMYLVPLRDFAKINMKEKMQLQTQFGEYYRRVYVDMLKQFEWWHSLDADYTNFTQIITC